ncbi:metaxin-1b isoform X1 [Tachysurus ichikawai]
MGDFLQFQGFPQASNHSAGERRAAALKFILFSGRISAGGTAYAKFAGAPLKVHKITNPWRSPTGTLPALRTREESSLSQPSKIIIQLRKQKYNADYDLSAKEGADTLAFVSLLEEKLLPALVRDHY